MKTLITILSLFVAVEILAAGQIYNTKNKTYIEMSELVKEVPVQSVVVLGEFHENFKIVEAQAKLIETITNYHNLAGQVSVGWEFLNHNEQDEIDKIFTAAKNESITGKDFLKKFYPGKNFEYLALVNAAAKVDAQLIGLNSPREIKREIRTKGIDSVDPKWIPDNMEVWEGNYFTRFNQAMGGHAPQEMIKQYYRAQCYVDSIMSESLIKNSLHSLKFLIAGSFHTDFRDGTVRKLIQLGEEVITIKIVDATNLTSPEKEEYEKGSSEFGQYSDYIYFAN